MLDDILTRYAAGTTGKELINAYRLNHTRLGKILDAHGVPRRGIAAAHHLRRSERGLTRAEMDQAGARCLPGRHICLWADHAVALDRLLDDYRAGTSLRDLSSRFPYSRGTITRILTEHAVPLRPAAETRMGRPPASASPSAAPTRCCRGRHLCRWADQTKALDQLLDDYRAGHSLRDLSRSTPWGRSAVASILDAHDRHVRTAREQRAVTPAAEPPVATGPSLRRCQPGHHACRWRQQTQDIDRVVAGWRSGHSMNRLADESPFSCVAIADILAEHDANLTDARSWWRSGRSGPCRPGRHKCHYTPLGDALDQLLAEYETGSAVNAVSKRYGMARGTVVRILTVHGVTPRGRSEQRIRVHLRIEQIEERIRAGETVTRLSAEVGLSRFVLGKRLAEYRSAGAAQTSDQQALSRA